MLTQTEPTLSHSIHAKQSEIKYREREGTIGLKQLKDMVVAAWAQAIMSGPKLAEKLFETLNTERRHVFERDAICDQGPRSILAREMCKVFVRLHGQGSLPVDGNRNSSAWQAAEQVGRRPVIMLVRFAFVRFAFVRFTVHTTARL